MTTSRRNFLFGRRVPASPWEQFCSRLSRTTRGSVNWESDKNIAVAFLRPSCEKDLLHAHALCREYGVQIWLDGLPRPIGAQRPALWIESGAAWAQLEPVDETEQIWRADAGCKIGDLHAKGFDWLADIDPKWSVAMWLASKFSAHWPTSQGEYSGLMKAEVLLADGTTASLGAFGENAKEPLRSLTVQRMVPKLFELSNSPIAQDLIRAERWYGGFRIDSIVSQNSDVNLARILTGHGGSLVWLLSVSLARTLSRWPAPICSEHTSMPEVSVLDLSRFDQQIKDAFDPTGVFAPIRDAKGLESFSE